MLQTLQSPNDLEYRSETSEGTISESDATSVTSRKSTLSRISTSESDKPDYVGYARFAPNALPTEVHNTEEQREDPWEKITSRDGIDYYYNWYTGMVRYDPPGSAEASGRSGGRLREEDALVARAERTNPHYKSLRRGKEAAETLDEPPESILTVTKYRGRAPWKAYFDRQTRTSFWKDAKGKRQLSNDVPRWFGPITLHV
ncbi:unnamed protein product [Amoebophrya sp. A25]|nr:unnamed protein product [Amoebophrya sp. A25]|eukprot:GSA25T00005937001.1